MQGNIPLRSWLSGFYHPGFLEILLPYEKCMGSSRLVRGTAISIAPGVACCLPWVQLLFLSILIS